MEKILYAARVHTVGGRNGASRSTDGCLDIQLSVPGDAGGGTNPEQLFAAAWSVSFLGALKAAADQLHVQLPASSAIDGEIDLIDSSGAYGLAARFRVSLPSIDPDMARQLISAANESCPYSHATRGNILVDIRLV